MSVIENNSTGLSHTDSQKKATLIYDFIPSDGYSGTSHFIYLGKYPINTKQKLKQFDDVGAAYAAIKQMNLKPLSLNRINLTYKDKSDIYEEISRSTIENRKEKTFEISRPRGPV